MTDPERTVDPEHAADLDVSGHSLLHEHYGVIRAHDRSRDLGRRNHSSSLLRAASAGTDERSRRGSWRRASAVAAPLGGLLAVVLVAAGKMS